MKKLNKDFSRTWNGMIIPSTTVLLSFCILSHTVSAAPVPFETILKQAVSKSPTRSVAESYVQEQKSLKEAAESGYYPSVDLQIKNGRDIDKGENSITPEASLTQTLYDFGRVHYQVQQAEAETTQAQALSRQELEDVLRKTADAYINHHRFQNLSKGSTRYIKAIKGVANIALLRAEAGASSQSDALQAKARVSSAEIQHMQIQTQFQTALQNLQILAGASESIETVDMPKQLFADARIQQPVDYEKNALIQRAASAYAVADARLGYARADSKPQIYLQLIANKSVEGRNPGTGVPYGDEQRVQVGVQYRLYQGNYHAASVDAATFARGTAEFRKKQALQDLEITITNLRTQITQLKNQQELLDKRGVTLDQTRDIYLEQYKLGSRPILDLLNIEQEIYQALNDRLATQHELWRSLTEYIILTGRTAEVFKIELP